MPFLIYVPFFLFPADVQNSEGHTQIMWPNHNVLTTGNNRFAEYRNLCRVHSIGYTAHGLSRPSVQGLVTNSAELLACTVVDIYYYICSKKTILNPIKVKLP